MKKEYRISFKVSNWDILEFEKIAKKIKFKSQDPKNKNFDRF